MSAINLIWGDRPPERHETHPAYVAFQVMGYRVRYSRWLYPQPRPERTRFSGGVNNSAEERNVTRVREWRASAKVVVDHANRVIVVPEALRDGFDAALRKAGVL